jgi:DNA-binding NarL/FixJ family response regulator
MATGNSHGRRPSVCLLSSHPLVLDEYKKTLNKAHIPSSTVRLDPVFSNDINRVGIPKASVYVVDSNEPFAGVLVETIEGRFPKSRVLVLGEKFSDTNAYPFLELGAKGLMTYSEALEDLPEAVRSVAHGSFWVDRNLLSRFTDLILRSARRPTFPNGPQRLSRREKEVLQGLLENLSNKEIAKRLNISERTAKFHVSNLLAKFDVRRRADLLMLQIHRSNPHKN